MQTRLCTAFSSRVTVLCAPAGFGKSVAVRQALDAANLSYVTYHLHASDISAAALARGLAEALCEVAQGLRSSYASAVEYAVQSDEPHEKLAVWFQRHLQDVSATVLLEDVHHTLEDRDAGAFLETLIEFTPKIRWVLTTRAALDLPVAAWQRDGIAADTVGTEELRLTKLEAHELARTCDFPAHFVETLFDETQGWPLAFHIGINLPNEIRELARLRPRTPSDAYAFLVRRLFDGYDSELREALFEASVFQEIDRDLLTAGRVAHTWDRLAALSESGLLLSASREGKLRFHDLFQSFLHDELRARDMWQQTLAAGAAALERCARVPDALRLYVQAGHEQDVLRLCEQYGFELMEQGRRDDVVAALGVIEHDRQNESATVLALHGMNESLLGRGDTAESWFLHGIEKAASAKVGAEIAYRYALDLIRRGRLDAIALLEPYAQAGELPGSLMASIESTLATAYVIAGRFGDGSAAMQRALALLPQDRSIPLHAKIHQHAAWVSLFTGDVENAKTHAALAVERAVEFGMYDVAARAYTVFYNICYDVEDDPVATMEILNSVLDCGLKAGSPQMRLFALLGMLDISAEMGDHDEVRRIAQILDSHEVDYSEAMASETLLPAEALRIASQGDFKEAYHLLVASGARQITPDRRALRFSEIALYAAAARMQSEGEAALAEVAASLDLLEPHARRTVRTRLNCALARYLLGYSDAARSMLATTAALPQGRLEAFRSAVESILQRWQGARNHGDLAQTLATLRERHFGGIADVLAALPHAPRKHSGKGRA